MPLYDYRCTSGHVFERMRPWAEDGDPHACAVCEVAVARRVILKAPRLVGPVFSDVEKFERALLTPQQRAAGVRITSQKDIDRIERKLGMSRVDPSSRASRAVMDDQRDDASDRARAFAEGGHAAVMDHNVKTEMQGALGWSDTRYSQWKEMKDAADVRIASGAAAQHVEPVGPVHG